MGGGESQTKAPSYTTIQEVDVDKAKASWKF